MLGRYTRMVGLPATALSRNLLFVTNSVQSVDGRCRVEGMTQHRDICRALKALDHFHCAIEYDEASWLNHVAETNNLVREKRALTELQSCSGVS